MAILSEKVTGYLENASWIRRMFELGSQLKAQYGAENVYDFSLGNPDLPAPQAVVDGLKEIASQASEPFAFGYMPNGGFPWLREKLARHLSAEQNINLGADEVILTNGAAGAINSFLRAVVNPGEEVITIAPYFVEYGFYCENHGATLKPVPANPKDFMPDLAALESAITPATRAVLINTPNNPTGAIYSAQTLKALARLLENKSQEYGKPIWLISDEPYRFLAYDGQQPPSILPLYPYAVAISSLSKNMSLPGERIGYIAISPRLKEKAELMAGLTLTNRILGFVNPPVIGQQILARAIGSNVDIDIYANRRKAMAETLRDGGYEFVMPQGAFYFFPKAPGGDDVAFVKRLLEERILAVPGSGFGWPGHFRLAFCVNENVIRNAAPGFARAAAALA
ncbi:MAG: pyridoxal phosphate-dependent aminotransferase [Desulfovibrio sp.]|nr:pyridoxal phosphate-dependent aminotransferase [Desulfovibrio sp.]